MTAIANDSSPQSAENEAYEFILRMIRQGTYKAGARLRAEDLAGVIGVSRMPVREALRRLDSEGLVWLRPHRGAVVAQYTAEQLFELFEIRSVLEGLAARIATEFVTDDEIDEMGLLIKRMDRAGQDYDIWSERHWAFHRYVCRLSGRKLLARDIEKLHNLLEPYLRIWFSHAKPKNVTAYHEDLLEAIATKDPIIAESKMKEHILSTASAVADFLRIGIEKRGRAKSPRQREVASLKDRKRES